MRQVNIKALLRGAWLAGGTLMLSAAAWAQGSGSGDAAAAGRSRMPLVDGIVSTIAFGLIGILLAILGFKLFDLVIRHNIEHEIFEHKNVAAAVLAGAVVLGVSLIVAATLLS